MQPCPRTETSPARRALCALALGAAMGRRARAEPVKAFARLMVA